MVAVLPMLVFCKYPLNDQLFKKIRNETEERKARAMQESVEASAR